MTWKYVDRKEKAGPRIVSVNTENIPTSEVYHVVNGGEVPRKQVDTMEELRKGSSGMVYRGCSCSTPMREEEFSEPKNRQQFKKLN